MRNKPIAQAFTKSLAINLKENMGHLVGLPFGTSATDIKLIAESIVVVPWDNFNRWIFQEQYHHIKDPVLALRIYTGHFFDVAVLTKISTEPFCTVMKDIRSYLVEMQLIEELEMITDSLNWSRAGNHGEELDSFGLLSL